MEGKAMFCDGCGAALQVEQAFCSRCGKEIKGGLRLAGPRRSRVREHIRFLGILWLAVSAFNSVSAVALLLAANMIFARPHQLGGESPPAFLHPLLTTIATLILAKAVAGFAAGWGLLQREPWARMVTLIVAFIALFNFPFGTALGVYSLWVLLPTESEREYEEQARAA
jgi:hypothetical protein